MRIKEINLYGYGKLIDLYLPNLSSLNIFYGENEAGKSTLMAFIHGILFGFPTKQQSDRRYEPKSHSRYGGSITLETSDYGEIIIERIKGKAVGDVTVTFSDGTQGGEEKLSEILRGMDKNMYQGIFSFDIQGIQEVQRLKGDDIGRYLFSAGTIGTDAILKTEQKLQKEMDLLFKPNGKNPKLNQMLHQLRDSDKELKKSKQQNQTYEQLHEQQLKLEQEINDIQVKLETNRKHIQKLEQFIHDWPLYQERKHILDQLNELGNIQFPVNGLIRLEQLEEKLRSVIAQQKVLEERKKKLIEQMEELAPNPIMTQNHTNVQVIIDKWPQVLQWQEDAIKLTGEIEKWNEQIENLKTQVDYKEIDIEHIKDLDLSIAMKDRLRSAMRNYYSLQSREAELLRQKDKEKNALTILEQQCDSIENRLLPEEEFRRISEKLQMIQQLEIDKKEIEERILRSHQQQGKNTNMISTILLSILFISIFLWSCLAKQPILSVGSLIGLMIACFSLWVGKKKDSKKNEKNVLEQQLNSIEKEIKKYQETSSIFENQQTLRKEWKEAIIQLEKEQVRYGELEEEVQKWSNEWSGVLNQLSEIKSNLRLKESFPYEQLSDAYEIIYELSRIKKNWDNTKTQLQTILDSKAKWQTKLEEQLTLLDLTGFSNDEGMVLLKKEVENENEKHRKSVELQKQLDTLEIDLLSVHTEKKSLSESISSLLHEADVSNNEEFRIKGDQYEKWTSLQSHLDILNKKIDENDILKMESTLSIKQLETERDKLKVELESDTNTLEVRYKQHAQVHHEISVLEEGGNYTEKLHEFYHLKSRFNHQAKEWAVKALAKEILQKTVERLKDERFPQVVKTAESILKTLTNDEYVRIYVNEKSKLSVERKDRMIFEPEELSQATGEQVYVALRLALVHVLKEDYPFPIIVDDGFVNFDDKRTKKILQLLVEISKSTQVLFFTCHEHLLNLFPKENIIHLMGDEKYTLLK